MELANQVSKTLIIKWRDYGHGTDATFL